MDIKRYMAAAVEAVKQFVRNDVRTGGNNQPACMDAAHVAVRNLYKRDKGVGGRLVFKKENIEELSGIFSSIDSDLSDFIGSRYIECSRRQKSTLVGKVTAKAILEPALKSYGLNFKAVYQQHCAKVSIEMDKGRWATLYVPYSKMKDDVLIERIPEAIAALNGMIQDFGRYFEVSGRCRAQ